MTGTAVVIGIGNSFRRDDGVGTAVADRIARRRLPGVRVVTATGEPAALLEAWTGAARAVVVDALAGGDSTPGRVRRWSGDDLGCVTALSSHALGLAQTAALGRALGRMPDELVVFTVDIADTGHGLGLTPAIAAAVPAVIDAVLAELARGMGAGWPPHLGRAVDRHSDV
ncbi:hydrogenase maturation protease [Mycobacterium sp.]|uniref:hydrogenase maturation protease n=1 Tax=Mycobacterium sp. TaxID=1785 RepID=UPI00127B484D|nr:hydrogenase maturation protease [Mycobacterium sp.]KAA8964655.1 MAG: hydrogenase maturation protease [Mycobacterium sp.]